MDNTGIGYSVKEVLELNNELERCLMTLKNSIVENWPTLISTLRNNWVGNDEYAFEDTFSARLAKVYNNCKSIIIGARTFFNDAANSWHRFQNNVGRQFNSDGIVINDFVLENNIAPDADYLDLPLIEQTDLTNVTLGLTTAGAENNLINAIDEFMISIGNAVTDAINQIETGRAFVGQEQSLALNEFISGLNDCFRNIINAIESFKNITIPELVRAYNEQQSMISSDTMKTSSTIDNIVTGNN